MVNGVFKTNAACDGFRQYSVAFPMEIGRVVTPNPPLMPMMQK
jgi:hypothetical protein